MINRDTQSGKVSATPKNIYILLCHFKSEVVIFQGKGVKKSISHPVLKSTIEIAK